MIGMDEIRAYAENYADSTLCNRDLEAPMRAGETDHGGEWLWFDMWSYIRTAYEAGIEQAIREMRSRL